MQCNVGASRLHQGLLPGFVTAVHLPDTKIALQVADILLRKRDFEAKICEAEEDPRPEAEAVSKVSQAAESSYAEEMIWYRLLCAEGFAKYKYHLHRRLWTAGSKRTMSMPGLLLF